MWTHTTNALVRATRPSPRRSPNSRGNIGCMAPLIPKVTSGASHLGRVKKRSDNRLHHDTRRSLLRGARRFGSFLERTEGCASSELIRHSENGHRLEPLPLEHRDRAAVGNPSRVNVDGGHGSDAVHDLD